MSARASKHTLHLNTGKTKAIIFRSDYNINWLQRLDLPSIGLQDNVFIPFVDTVTNLGVVMDSKLTWKSQIDAVSRKVYIALYGLRSFSSCTTEDLRKQLASGIPWRDRRISQKNDKGYRMHVYSTSVMLERAAVNKWASDAMSMRTLDWWEGPVPDSKSIQAVPNRTWPTKRDI